MSTEFLFLLIVLFFGGIISTVAGGGLSLILITAGSLFMDVKLAIVLNAYILLLNQSAKAWNFYPFAKRNIVLWAGLSGIIPTYIGARTLFLVSIETMQIIIACTAIGFVILRNVRLLPVIKETKLNLVILGILSGFFGGLTGNGSLIRKPLFLQMGITKEVFLGTTSLLSLVLITGTLGAFIPETPWTLEYITFLILAAPTLLLSVAIAKWILRYMSAELFSFFLQAVIVIGAVRLLLK